MFIGLLFDISYCSCWNLDFKLKFNYDLPAAILVQDFSKHETKSSKVFQVLRRVIGAKRNRKLSNFVRTENYSKELILKLLLLFPKIL